MKMNDSLTKTSPPPIQTQIDGAVGVIELSQPETFNCLSQATFTSIEEAFDTFERPDSGVRAVIVRAQGKHFCTGANLKELKGVLDNHVELRKFLKRGHSTLNRMEASPLPIIAICQGLCLAGGLELAMACDVIFADSQAKFGDQHGKFGIIPGWGGSQRLPRLIGHRRATDLMLSARWIDANTALNWGLINFVYDSESLSAQALEYCAVLAGRSPSGISTMKRLLRTGVNMSLTDGLLYEENEACISLRSRDVAEGIAAFEQRREPIFGST